MNRVTELRTPDKVIMRKLAYSLAIELQYDLFALRVRAHMDIARLATPPPMWVSDNIPSERYW